MSVLPPGTILQLSYLRERLAHMPLGRFAEMGPGQGEITHMLLDAGWRGTSYELDAETIARLQERFKEECANGALTIVHGSYLDSPASEKVDLVISCMVMEHLDERHEQQFMQHAAQQLNPNGRMIGMVPSSPDAWGIEDEIAGHYRRYSRGMLSQLAERTGWVVQHAAGLTYPLSNLLLPLSNHLVKRAEKQKLELSMLERTKESGKRDVAFKTHFPGVLALLLNRVTMTPLHWLQKYFSHSTRALILYFEAVPHHG